MDYCNLQLTPFKRIFYFNNSYQTFKAILQYLIGTQMQPQNQKPNAKLKSKQQQEQTWLDDQPQQKQNEVAKQEKQNSSVQQSPTKSIPLYETTRARQPVQPTKQSQNFQASSNSPTLPIHSHRKQIIASIRNNRVTVISGRTGCGKSTQVPKYILKEFPKAKIAICEPRRLAATSLAIRVAEEIRQSIGHTVGYQIGMESKFSDKTQIMYMTYGILIQIILFNRDIQFTHIILDEVHQRSLQMDFTFIALKKILDSQLSHKKQQTRVVIMSATINSAQFCKYFSTDISTHKFLKPNIKYVSQQPRQRTRGRKRNTSAQKQKQKIGDIKIQLNYQHHGKQYRQAESIVLPDVSNFQVSEYFIEDFGKLGIGMASGDGQVDYVLNEDVRIRDQVYRIAVRLIQKHLRDTANTGQNMVKSRNGRYQNKNIVNDQICGDVLIFVPGMFQIKFLKDLIINQGIAEPRQIIEVHSAYSQQLYKRLFVQKIAHKIIIATNIGQSSITLPFCKTVIDFCLTRKNITIKMKGYSRFQTRVASKANLMQRAGRVGRISDGIVYRLISRSLYNRLDDFDVPQIQCVSLDMVILRAKQIDKTNNSDLFQDPYQVFFNAIEPPKYEQIHSAIQYLLKQQALQLMPSVSQSTSSQQPASRHLPKNLKITKIGQFMVSMPCNIRISKMIIHSLGFGITSTIIDIAAILLTQKQFFQHEEKRYSIEEFMHSIIGYDRGDYNDFLMRQRMFAHWRSNFFQQFKKSKYQNSNLNSSNTQDIKRQNQQIQRMLQQFSNTRITTPEHNFCSDRGFSPWTMRDILRISQNIRLRLAQAQIFIQRNNKEEVRTQLVIFCLCIAFQDTTCRLQWKGRRRNDEGNWVSLIQSDKTTQQDIQDYMHPLKYNKDYTIQPLQGGFLKIRGSCPAMSKLLLPRHYIRSNTNNTSPLYRYLCSNPPKVTYCYQFCIVRERVREVTILNDSINKVNIRPEPIRDGDKENLPKSQYHQEYMLITDKIFDSKGKYYMGACAQIQKKVLTLIKMMTVKDVYLEPHVSWQFYSHVIINRQPTQLPFLLRNEDIETIKYFRKINIDQKQRKLSENMIEQSKRQKFQRLLSQIPLKPPLEPWTHIYNRTVQQYKKLEQKPIHLQNFVPLKQIKNEKQGYFERYKRWKTREHEELYLNFRILNIKKTAIICSKCWPNNLIMIDDLDAFCTEKKVLKLNQYRGSWIKQKNNLFCSRKHNIGYLINPDEGSIQYQNVLMYAPMAKTSKFTGQADQIAQLQGMVAQGVQQIQRQRARFYEFQCKICSTYNEYEGLKRCIIEKAELDTAKFWKKVSDHMYSKKHMENLEAFLIDI